MTTLLHVDASVNDTDESITRDLTRRFVTAWRAAEPDATILRRDLARAPVPPIGRGYAALGRRLERDGLVAVERVAGQVRDDREAREWAATLPLIEEVRAADVIVIGAPMYNYAVSSTLKAWIDRITFPGAFDAGALDATRVVIATASGGAYGPGTPRAGWDFQTPYLRRYFAGLGVAEVTIAGAELCLSPVVPRLAGLRDRHDASLADARDRIAELAAERRPA